MSAMQVCLRIVLQGVLVVGAAGQSPILRVLDEPLPVDMGEAELAADFDGDGDADLLTASGIFLNDGHGRFSPGPAGVLAYQRVTSVAADFNGDGRVDVVTVDSTLVPRVELNTGGLAFTSMAGAFPSLGIAGPYALPSRAAEFCAGDVDGDGDVDLVAQVRSPTASNGVYGPAAPILLLNSGTGNFTVASPAVFPLGAYATDGGVLADFDGDGDMDVVLSNSGAPAVTPRLLVAWNLGTAFMVSTIASSGIVFLDGLGEGDFNGDGRRDVVVSGSSSTTGAVYAIHLGTAAGLAAPVTSPLTSSAPIPGRPLISVDVNADGRDELLVGTVSLGTAYLHSVSPTGSVGPASRVFPGVVFSDQFGLSRVGVRVVADLDGDGDRDLCVRSFSSPALLMNDSSGGFEFVTGRVQGMGYGWVSTVGDFDGDGDADAARWASVTTAGSTVGVSRNDGNGFFSDGASSAFAGTIGNYLHLHAFDRDGDGDADLYGARNMVSSFGPAGNDLVLDCSNGIFTVVNTLPDHGPVTVVRDVDVDGDGDRDIVLGRRGATTIGNGMTGPMLLLVNLGGSFAPAIQVGGNQATYDLEIADFDGNGAPDVFQSNATFPPGGTSSVLYLNNGAGVFASYPQPSMSGNFACAGDLNGDALPDLVVDGSVWFNAAGTGFVLGPPLPSALSAPASLVDIDRDGDLDLVETPATVMFNAGGGAFGPPVFATRRFAYAPTSWTLPASAVRDLDGDGDDDVIGGDGRIHMNTTVQVALGSRARPGRPASLDLFGTPGGGFLLFASPGTARLPLPPYGQILIDPAPAELILAGVFAPPGSSSPGTGSLLMQVPPLPSFIGQSVHWQLLEASGRLSNRTTTTIGGY